MEPLTLLKKVLDLFENNKDNIAISISLISLVISILRYRREGKDLKLTLEKKSDKVIILTAKNIGFASVKVTDIYVVVRNKRIPVNTEFELPYNGQKKIEISLVGYDFHPFEIKRVEVIDISGKVYKATNKRLMYQKRLETM